MYLFIENFKAFHNSLTRSGGGFVFKGDQGDVYIAIETTRDCQQIRLVLDMELYSEEFFMYEIEK